MPRSDVTTPGLLQKKSKPGVILAQGGGIKLIKLVGKRGSGKSRFYLSEIVRVAENIATTEYNRVINWSSEEDCVWVEEEITPKICVRVLDMDMKGTEELIARPAVFPKPLLGCIEKWGITGVPEEGIDAYDEAKIAFVEYLRHLDTHARKYPKYRFARFLILESEEMLYTKAKDHYVKIAYEAEGAENQVDLMLRRREQHARTDKFAVLFKGGPRDEFGQGIYPMLQNFLTNLVAYSGDVGYNVYMTAHVVEKWVDYEVKELRRKEEFIAGAPNMTDGFFDAIILFEKIQRKDVEEPSLEYYLSTETQLSKNRLCADITMKVEYNSPSNGASGFWKEVERLRQEEMK